MKRGKESWESNVAELELRLSTSNERFHSADLS